MNRTPEQKRRMYEDTVALLVAFALLGLGVLAWVYVFGRTG